MSRLPGWLLVAAVLVALAACGGDDPATGPVRPDSATPSSPAASESPKAVTTPELDSIAVMGHSGATGTRSDPDDPSRDATENSWATGDNPAVRSIYLRLAQTHPALQGHSYNVAVNGTGVDNLDSQLQRLMAEADPLPDVVIVQTIDNDMRCDGSDSENYQPFGDALKQALSTIEQQVPGVDLFLVSQWGTVANWTAYAAKLPSIAAANAGTGPCDVFSLDGKIRPAGVRSLQRIVDRYWVVVEAACASLPRCFTDGGAMQSMRIDTQDVAADGNHLSIQGHAKMAAIAWRAFPAEIKHRT